MIPKERTFSRVTDAGFQVIMEPPGATCVVFTMRSMRVSITQPDKDQTVAQPEYQNRWFVHGQMSVWFPTEIGQMEAAVTHWCSYYTTGLQQEITGMLAVFGDLPLPSTEEAKPEGATLN